MLNTEYAEKSDDYYEYDRSDLVIKNFEITGKKILEIGCGRGMTLGRLRSAYKAGLCVGVDPYVDVVDVNPAVDEFYKKHVDEILDWNSAKFDIILLLDVLEHLTNPAEVLVKLRNLLNEGGVLIISVPNARNFRLVWNLVVLGDFAYQKSGIMDETHLKWFTKRSFKKTLESAGYEQISTSDTGIERYKPLWFINVITLGIFRDYLRYQNIFVIK